MKIKGGNSLLEHFEKIILAIAAVFFFLLLIFKVITSPNDVEYNGKKYSPGAIDKVIYKKAEDVRIIIESPPKLKELYKPKSKEFIAKFKSPVDVDTSLWPPLPAFSSGKIDRGERYAVPSGPEISDVQVEHIRAVAYIPVEEIDNDTPYQNVETEPNDLDIVTVEARVNIQKLYEAFTENFAGPAVKPEWQDPDLAKPVFAAIQLQRSEQLSNGQWSDWKDVPRIKTDNMSNLLKIIEDVHELPRGGLEVRLLQYRNSAVKANLLQSWAYDIGSAEEDWFPPTLHREFTKRMQEEEAAKRRAEMEERRQEREQELEAARSERSQNRTGENTRSGRTIGGGMGELSSGMGGGRPNSLGGAGGERPARVDRSQELERRRLEREEKKRQRLEAGQSQQEDKSIDAVYKKFQEILINEDTDLAEMTEPLLFWAHDDTVEVGKTYRYRIRLGVFNPIAGTKKIKSDYESYKNQVILWSNALETEEIEIPKKLYFFAKDIQQAANTVKVEVFRYILGYWYPAEYAVEAGEAIGKIDEIKKEESDEKSESSSDNEKILMPEKVDFRTGAIMVDTAEAEDWFGSNILSPRRYFNFYYSYDGSSIEEMPIQQSFWALKTRELHSSISKASKQEKKPLRPRGEGIEGYGPEFQPQEGTRGVPLELMRTGPIS
ncbi:MAG: hypothetical protein JW804_04955 [Sedimentisphaerales bacterium]|nr:hypothetical protein [Sedimentisphaerales bacterium]